MDSGELRNVDLAAATSIRFTDPKLQLQFKDYLAALTGARSKDQRSVYIDSTDAKSRDVRAEYIIPMPAWKSSYRLLFGENGAQPTLEGWAIVDNTTGEDWTNVKLSLVSGQADFVHQPAVSAEVHCAAGRGTGGGSACRADGLYGRGSETGSRRRPPGSCGAPFHHQRRG